MQPNFSQIPQNLIKYLEGRQKTVISRRFGLNNKKRETLESIGQDFNITRERVRQIERDAILALEPELKNYDKIFQYFKQYFKSQGGLKREDLLLADLGGENAKNQVYFLLNLKKEFQKMSESENFHPFWFVDKESLSFAQNAIAASLDTLKKEKKLLNINDLKKNNASSFSASSLNSYLEISKRIGKNKEGFFGLKEWPEINPRGVKDKAYLVFKKEKKPLHFREVAKLIEKSLPQTVHNELIKDSRFVLVGRGIYALQEWGYSPGYVKDIIAKILKEAKKPLNRETVLEKVLEQRFVKENTVLLNLSNKKYFLRDISGNYTVREG